MRGDGILHARFEVTGEPTEEAAIEYAAARQELTGGRPVPVIVEIVAIPFVDRAVRGLFMASMEPPVCRAVVTTDTTYRSMFKSFQILEQPTVATEYFPTVPAALAWIDRVAPDR